MHPKPINLQHTDTQRIAENIESSLRTVKAKTDVPREILIRARVAFIKSVLDAFRYKIIFQEPSKN